MRPKHITFTGIDDHTNFKQLKVLSNNSECEWGILFSRNRQGIDPRYPSYDIIEQALSTGLVFAAHLCGKIADQVMTTSSIDIDLSKFSRVQVNHINPSPASLARFCDKIGMPIIAQWRDGSAFPDEYEGVSWLYDTSGGAGVAPDRWPINPSRHAVGYAGGINPENVASVVNAISDLSPAGFWIDMETGVRTDNHLDLEKVQAVIDSVETNESH